MHDPKSRLDQEGYFIGHVLPENDVEKIRSIIREHVFSTIRKSYPELISQFEILGIENYHQLSSKVDHRHMWPQDVRCLNSDDISILKKTELFSYLLSEFNGFEVEDGMKTGHGTFIWRLVRPHEEKDVNVAHADIWFVKLNNLDTPENKSRVQIWIPIICEKGLNGLKIVPDSHKHPENYPFVQGSSDLVGNLLPKVDFDEKSLGLELIHTKPGDVIVFHPGLIHKGAINNGKYCRISLEFTIYV